MTGAVVHVTTPTTRAAPTPAAATPAAPTPAAAEHLAALEAARREAAAVADDLSRELAAIAGSTAASPDDEHDPEGSTIGHERARVRGLLAAAHETLARLDRAIGRAREGRAAFCERCGAAIDSERLRALPGTPRCAPCARLASTRKGLDQRRQWRSR